MNRRHAILVVLVLLCGFSATGWADEPATRRLLYVGAPGVRDDLQVGGQGVLVFDIDREHRFVKRIPSQAGLEKPANIKGICASAVTRRLYQTTPTKLYCLDLVTEKPVWAKELPLGCDRMSITPDGKVLYVPSFEKETWNVVDAMSGNVLKSITTNSGAHNTVCGFDGKKMYLAGLKSPWLFVADTATHAFVPKVGPFSAAIRPFTVNAAGTRCYVCVNELLGFEVGDLTTGKKMSRVEVAGFEKGPVKRHGCPSHGVGLRPDERELWLCDAHNSRLHVFDLSTDPPKLTDSIILREQPGWVTFSLDGDFAYASTGEVIDTKGKRIVTALRDEQGREVHSEKMLEIDFRAGVPIRVGDQFGVGRAPTTKSVRN